MDKKAEKDSDKDLDGQGNEGTKDAGEYACRNRASIQVPQVGIFDSWPELRNPTIFNNGLGRRNVFFEYVFQGQWLPDSCQSALIMPAIEA
ncbi:hypothetical protein [Ketobacter sp.]|uniref:hypothetical protein n=1 Tax=Ketobacter sp. TaxID=2083498 RepID=UPI0025C713A9|nr:hypothetical protein [Ketobacter sp.]